jgi:hypothetical protein
MGAYIKKLDVDDKHLYALSGDRFGIYESMTSEFKPIHTIEHVQYFVAVHKDIEKLEKLRATDVITVCILH